MDKNILLVQPAWPIPRKSKWHAKYLPIGLLKLAAYYRNKGCAVKLVYGNVSPGDIPFVPDEIKITSLFTYWWHYVKSAFDHYTKLYPNAKIDIGGIYASLMPGHVKEVFGIQPTVGVLEEAERYQPAYDLVEPIDYQIIHASRGCSRRCPYCGAWIIEPKQSFKTWEEIKKEICKRIVIFYDSDFLSNPNIEEILEGLANYRYQGKVLHCEAQSGFAYWKITPKIAKLIKKARFRAVRISWDRGLNEMRGVIEALKNLKDAGYHYKNTQVFMLYNYYP
ncbi:MAG: radical SAM protein, partial [Candidatus Thermoplasmatota archaeon]